MTKPKGIMDASYSDNIIATIRYNANPDKVVKVLDALTVGVALGKPRDLAEALMYNHHDPEGWKKAQAQKKQLKKGKRIRGVPHAGRTFILSVQTPPQPTRAQLSYIDSQLEGAFFDLQKKLKVPALGWIHGNTKTRHVHILMPNSDGQNAINIGPKMLSDLQGFGWTTALDSGRGHGVTQGLHPKKFPSKELAARDLACALLDETGRPSLARWEQLKKEEAVTNFRHRKDGSIISLDYGGEHFRTTTLLGELNYQLPVSTPRPPMTKKTTLEDFLAAFTPAFISAPPALSPPPSPALPVPPPPLPVAPPLVQPLTPLEQFVLAAQRAEREQNQTQPGVNTPGISL